MFKKAIFLFLALTLYSCGRDLDRHEDYPKQTRDYRDYNAELEDMTYVFFYMMDFVLDRYEQVLEDLYQESDAHDRTIRKSNRVRLKNRLLNIQYENLQKDQYESFKMFKDELEDSKKSLILAESLAEEGELKNHLKSMINELTEMEGQIDEILKEMEASMEEDKKSKDKKEPKGEEGSEEDKSSSDGEAEDSSAGADSENIGLTGVKLSEGADDSTAGVDAGGGEAEDTQAPTVSGEAEVQQEEVGSGEADAGSEDTGADSVEAEGMQEEADSGSEATEGAGLNSQVEADSSTASEADSQAEADSPEAQDSQGADSSTQVEADSQGAEATGVNVGSGDPISVSIEAKGLPSDQTIVIKLEEEKTSDN